MRGVVDKRMQCRKNEIQQNAIQILTQLYYLREVPPVQRKPLESVFEDVSDMAKGILAYGEHVCDDPVNWKEEKNNPSSALQSITIMGKYCTCTLMVRQVDNVFFFLWYFSIHNNLQRKKC